MEKLDSQLQYEELRYPIKAWSALKSPGSDKVIFQIYIVVCCPAIIAASDIVTLLR